MLKHATITIMRLRPKSQNTACPLARRTPIHRMHLAMCTLSAASAQAISGRLATTQFGSPCWLFEHANLFGKHPCHSVG